MRTPVSEVLLSAAAGRNQNTRAKNAKKPRAPRQNKAFFAHASENTDAAPAH
jgi:hypothetical protein